MSTLSPTTLKMKPVPVITDEELAALLKACAGKEFSDRRDEALIRLLLDCGVRVARPAGCELISWTSTSAWQLSRAKAPRSGRSTSVRAPSGRLTASPTLGYVIESAFDALRYEHQGPTATERSTVPS
jgi:site-specific recombinase XerC